MKEMKEKTTEGLLAFCAGDLPTVLHHRRDQLPTNHHSLQLLRHGLLLEHPLLLPLHRQTDINRATFRRHNLCVQALAREVHLDAVGTVDEEGRDATEDLDGY